MKLSSKSLPCTFGLCLVMKQTFENEPFPVHPIETKPSNTQLQAYMDMIILIILNLLHRIYNTHCMSYSDPLFSSLLNFGINFYK